LTRSLSASIMAGLRTVGSHVAALVAVA